MAKRRKARKVRGKAAPKYLGSDGDPIAITLRVDDIVAALLDDFARRKGWTRNAVATTVFNELRRSFEVTAKKKTSASSKPSARQPKTSKDKSVKYTTVFIRLHRDLYVLIVTGAEVVGKSINNFMCHALLTYLTAKLATTTEKQHGTFASGHRLRKDSTVVPSNFVGGYAPEQWTVDTHDEPGQAGERDKPLLG